MGTPAPSVNFLVKPDEKRKYDALFEQLKPQGGLLPGDKVGASCSCSHLDNLSLTPDLTRCVM